MLALAGQIASLGQHFVSPFPATAPVVGYEFQPAFTNVSWGDPNRPEQMVVRGGKLYTWSKDQRVTVVTNTLAPTRTLFLDNLANSWTLQDSGMPGLAFHPNGSNVFTFASETNRVDQVMVDRLRKWTIDPANPNRVLSTSEIILEQVDRSNEHLGGALFFGPDGYLYLSLSDEGGQNGVFGNTQRIDRNFFSGVIRIDVDGRPGNLVPNPHPAIKGFYRVPADNPWVGATNFNGVAVDPTKVRTEFWAVGLRNPHTMVHDATSGRTWIADVGNLRWESLFELAKGANYGWNWTEGPEATTFAEAPPIATRPAVQFRPPVWAYPHAGVAASVGVTDPRAIGNCIIGGILYRGTKYPGLNGKLICSDYLSRNVWAVGVGTPTTVEWIGTHPTGASAWAVDPSTGDILAASFSAATISRMVPASYTTPIPLTLSQTGVFADLATMTAAPGVLPYDVANTFWGDGAGKDRWFFLPPGGVVTRDAADQWSFPAGTVWVKHFELGGGRLETRFQVKTATGAYGLTYRWRADGSDADLVVSEGADTVLSWGQPWHFPAWSECATCHNAVAGFALGFSTRQLNVTVGVEGGGTVNQLEGLSALGVFNPPILSAAGLPVLSRPSDTNFALVHRVKSYTDANCSYCHQPGGDGRGEWDARFSVPMESSGIIGGAVTSDLGMPGSAVIFPGDTNRSVMFRRVADWTASGPAEYHMPPLATRMPNTAAIQLLAEYIASLAPRTNWFIGTNGPVSAPYNEFSIETRINDATPGSASKLDDDYYTAGTYPAGFNGLTAALTVEADEPWTHWERALTHADRTNRLHLVTSAGPATLTLSLNGGGALTNGVPMTPVIHNIVVQHRGAGSVTPLANYQVVGNVVLTIPFTAAEGAQTIELIRTSPTAPNCSYWVTFDRVAITR